MQESILAHHSCLGGVKKLEQVMICSRTNLMNIQCTSRARAPAPVSFWCNVQCALCTDCTLLLNNLDISTSALLCSVKVMCSVLNSSDSHALLLPPCLGPVLLSNCFAEFAHHLTQIFYFEIIQLQQWKRR